MEVQQPKETVVGRLEDVDKVAEHMRRISEFVKNDVFKFMKFVFNQNLLDEKGSVHQHFLYHVESKLSIPSHWTKEERLAYYNALWRKMKEKRREGEAKIGYNNWLSEKRTSVYRSLQSKFECKCQHVVCERVHLGSKQALFCKALVSYCRKNGCVLPSIETFHARIEDPKTYFLFYEYFYKPCVGEKEWMSELRKEESPRMGNASTEAFAHLALKNYYWAWILESYIHPKTNAIMEEEEDTDFGLLKTEYETEVDNGENKPLVDVLYGGWDVALKEETSQNSEGGGSATPNNEDAGQGEEVQMAAVVPPVFEVVKEKYEKQTYKSLLEKRKVRTKALHKEIKENAFGKRLREFLKKNSEIGPPEGTFEKDEEVNEKAPEYEEAARRNKKTILARFRDYTGTMEGAKRSKQWDERAYDDMDGWAMEIREDQKKRKYEGFEKMYRKMAKKGERGKMKKKPTSRVPMSAKKLQNLTDFPVIPV